MNITFLNNSNIFGENTPTNENLTLDFSNAIIGATACCFHNSESEPEISGGVMVVKSGVYDPNKINVIWLNYIGDEKVILNIQNSLIDFPVSDTTAPTTPLNLTANNVAQTTVDLSWSPSTDNVEVVGYDVYQNGIFLITSVNINFGVTGLLPETAYQFSIKAKDFAGNVSGESNVVNVTTLATSNDVVSNLTFNNAKKNLLTNPSAGVFSTTGTIYSGYGNSDYKIPANTKAWVDHDVTAIVNTNVMLGFATTDINGNYTLTKFNFTVYNSTTNPKMVTHYNGALLDADAGQYYYGVNSKVRLLREANGEVKLMKSSDGVNFELVYTWEELYTGELFIVNSIYNSAAKLINPKGTNVILK